LSCCWRTGGRIGTGSGTELGRINQLLASVSLLETPLLRQIKKFGYLITAAVGVMFHCHTSVCFFDISV
jgi:magnesium-transporting ATPase (P-type)